MENLSGQNIKGYELRERIGAGGFGAVYRANQSTVGREVAVKIILPHFASHPDFIRRFETEAQLVARLEHLHIVPLYDYWRDPDGAYLVMRWLKGGSLREAINNGPFAPEAAALLLDQVGSALASAHRNNIIHRDLKPGNILLDEDGNAYLADFGIAKDVGTSGNITEPEAIVGSPDYLAPEQARGEQVTPRTDIYSLGVVLYEILTGQHPFPNLNMVERLYKHLNKPLPEIASLPEDIRQPVNEVIQKATAKNPQNRYADTQELADAFRAAIKSITGNALVETLTQREQQILTRIIVGRSNKEIADELFISVTTVKWYVRQIYQKLGVRSRVQAIVRARELDLITKPTTSIEPPSIPTDQFHPENPYKGLCAFQSADHQDFFGREKLVEKLLHRLSDSALRREEDEAANRFLAVVGPSGSGKSSLVKAGLIPALWRGVLPGSEKWFVVEMLPGSHPLEELEIALSRVAANQVSSLNEHLIRDSRGLLRAASLILPNDNTELVIVIDQFEEVFTLVENKDERKHFLDILHTAVTTPRSRVRVVITLRADFYDRPLHYPQFGELIRSRMETILPLSAEGLERAIARPAERVGVSFEPGLVATIISEINYQAGALPLLQYALTELFEQRQGRQLTQEAYQAIGRTTGALAKRAEELYCDLTPEAQEAAHQMFLRLVTLGEGAEDTRRRADRSELLSIAGIADEVDEIIDMYAEYRLLSLDNDPGTRSPTVEVAHEAILREWRRLSNWITENREDIKMRQQLNRTAAEWQERGKEVSYLASGQRLEQFEGLVDNKRQALTVLERAYLEASLAERRQQQAAEMERQARETRLERRSQRFLQGLVVVLMLATLGAFGLTATTQTARQEAENQANRALMAQQQAEDQARIATARELVGYANANLNTDAELSTLLAMEAVNTTYQSDGSVLPEANTVLHQAVQGLHMPLRLQSAVYPDWWLPTAFTADGNRIIYPLQIDEVNGIDEMMAVADATSGQLQYTFKGGTLNDNASDNQYTSLVFDGLTYTLVRWDISSSQNVQRLNSIPIHVANDWQWMDATPDLHYFTVTSPSEGTQVWDLTSSEKIALPTPVSFQFMTFSPNGAYLGGRGSDGMLYVFNTGTWTEKFVASPSGTTVNTHEQNIRFSLDGRFIVTSNINQTISLWDTASGKELYAQPTNFEPSIVAINRDGSRIGAASNAGAITVWDSSTVRQPLNLTASEINSITFSPDGTKLAAIGSGSVQIWHLTQGEEVLTMQTSNVVGDNGPVSLAYSPDGKRLVTASVNISPIIWDTQTGQKLVTLTGHTKRVLAVAWSSNGKLIASAGDDHDVLLWDAETGTQVSKLSGHVDSIYGLAFSPDNTRIASSSYDKTINIWDVATGKVLVTLQQPERSKGVAWSVDSTYIAAGTDIVNGSSHIFIWNVTSGKQQLDIPAGNTRIGMVTFSPDGKHIVAGALELKSALVWDTVTGEKVLTVSDHVDLVPSVAYNIDGKQFATASLDGTVKLWDANSGQEMLTLFGASDGVGRVVFSPDGKHLATQNVDGTTRIYILDMDDLLALAQSRLTRTWTVDECQRYLHTDTCPPNTPETTSG